jgi:hypothetical protein
MATYLLAHGVEPRTVMEILGHSTIRLTMDLYGHVLPDRPRAAASAMDRVMETRVSRSGYIVGYRPSLDRRPPPGCVASLQVRCGGDEGT